MTIDVAAGTAIDAILDSGATASIFPRNYLNLTKLSKYENESHATMADSTSYLKLYSTAMYGSFEVLVGDIHRPFISEGALTSKPHNLSIVKSGNSA